MNLLMNFGETTMMISDLIQDCPIILVEEDNGKFHNYKLKVWSFEINNGRNVRIFVMKDKEVEL